MEDLFGQQLDDVLKDFNASMNGIEHRLDRYRLPDEQLTPDEQLEKTLLIGAMSVVDQAVQEPAAGTSKPVPPPAKAGESGKSL
jgi:hypothetical protein